MMEEYHLKVHEEVIFIWMGSMLDDYIFLF